MSRFIKFIFNLFVELIEIPLNKLTKTDTYYKGVKVFKMPAMMNKQADRAGIAAVARSGVMLVSHDIYDELLKGSSLDHILEHEYTHVMQRERDGFIKFLWKYNMNPWVYESEAYATYAKFVDINVEEFVDKIYEPKLYGTKSSKEDVASMIRQYIGGE